MYMLNPGKEKPLAFFIKTYMKVCAILESFGFRNFFFPQRDRLYSVAAWQVASHFPKLQDKEHSPAGYGHPLPILEEVASC